MTNEKGPAANGAQELPYDSKRSYIRQGSDATLLAAASGVTKCIAGLAVTLAQLAECTSDRQDQALLFQAADAAVRAKHLLVMVRLRHDPAETARKAS